MRFWLQIIVQWSKGVRGIITEMVTCQREWRTPLLSLTRHFFAFRTSLLRRVFLNKAYCLNEQTAKKFISTYISYGNLQ